MRLDFSNEYYKNLALKINKCNYDYSLSEYDAFLILLNGISYETLDNLCSLVSSKTSIESSKIYDYIQNRNCEEYIKKEILNSAYELIEEGYTLEANKNIDNSKRSTWICHCLLVGKLSSLLAKELNLDEKIAMKLGILHDIGRKFNHSFIHTIKGFEYLNDLGCPKEAVSCLTHSFLSDDYNNKIIKGSRCANCDPVLDGFYVDENGMGKFEKEEQKDDMALFLDNYEFNLYDMVLNISDLMATSSMILSPYERMLDIYTRKPPNKRTNMFFKNCFINVMRKLLFLLTKNNKYEKLYKYGEIDNLDEELKKTSDEFYEMYKSLIDIHRSKTL